MVFDFSKIGGDEEDRTLDLTDANRTLSQLSYAPIFCNTTILLLKIRFVKYYKSKALKFFRSCYFKRQVL